MKKKECWQLFGVLGEVTNLVRQREEASKKEFDEIQGIDISTSSKSLSKKCKRMLDIDSTIRFAGVFTIDGKILAAEYKKGAEPSSEDLKSEFLTTKQTLSGFENSMFTKKFGKQMYSIHAYEKIKRAAFALDDGILVISFDRSGNENMIINKVIYDVGLN